MISDSGQELGHFIETLSKPLSDFTEQSESVSLCFSPESSLAEMNEALTQGKADCILILEDKKPVGVITEQDFIHSVPLDSEKAQALCARDFMSQNPITLTSSSPVREAVVLMAKRKFRHLPVIDEQGDFLFTMDMMLFFTIMGQCFEKYYSNQSALTKWSHITVDEYKGFMPSSHDETEEITFDIFFQSHLKRLCYYRPIIVGTDTTVKEAISLMAHRRRSAILINEYETQLVGILTERDLLRRFYPYPDLYSSADEMKVIELMTAQPHTLLNKHSLGQALSNLQKYHYRHIIIVDEDKQALSVIDLIDIFKFVIHHILGAVEDEA